MAYKITVAICTYNRAELLKTAIESLLNQTAAENDFEILIVNNNSTDNTAELLDKYKKHKNFRFVIEKEAGLSNARNCAFKNANAQYIAYIDDDAKAPANYVEKALQTIEIYAPDIFGGPIFPYYNSKKPEWFKDEYETYSFHDHTGWLPKGKSLSGSNMIYTKACLQELAGFDPQLGMKGSEMFYGEESDLILRAHAAGKTIFYNNNMPVLHIVPRYKMNFQYYYCRFFEAGRASWHFAENNKTVSITEKQLLLQIEELTKSLQNAFLPAKNIVAQMQAGNFSNEIDQMFYEQVLKRNFVLGYLFEKSQTILQTKRTFIQKILHFNLYKLFSRNR